MSATASQQPPLWEEVWNDAADWERVRIALGALLLAIEKPQMSRVLGVEISRAFLAEATKQYICGLPTKKETKKITKKQPKRKK